MYTMSSSVALQTQVLNLLVQLIQLRVNYCLLDNDEAGAPFYYAIFFFIVSFFILFSSFLLFYGGVGVGVLGLESWIGLLGCSADGVWGLQCGAFTSLCLRRKLPITYTTKYRIIN